MCVCVCVCVCACLSVSAKSHSQSFVWIDESEGKCQNPNTIKVKKSTYLWQNTTWNDWADGQSNHLEWLASQKVMCWGAWAATCRHKAKDITPSVTRRREAWATGSTLRSSLKCKRAIVNQTNIGTVSRAVLGKLLRDKERTVKNFFLECIDTILNWTIVICTHVIISVHVMCACLRVCMSVCVCELFKLFKGVAILFNSPSSSCRAVSSWRSTEQEWRCLGCLLGEC